jgi:chemotaxis protein methyltransferase CheR
MPSPETVALLGRLRDVVRQKLGLHYEDRGLELLACKLESLASTPEALAALAEALERDDNAALEALSAQLTIGETWFFRGIAQLEALVQWGIPELRLKAGASGSVTVWDAACASGEEAYTLALLFERHAPDLRSRLRLLASDLNEAALAKARQGTYGASTLRRAPAAWADCYLGPYRDREQWNAPAALRELISFQRHNLVCPTVPQGLLPGRVDLIVCRNVLIYFHVEDRRRVLSTLQQALRPGGILVLGESESLAGSEGWDVVERPGAFLYRKQVACGAVSLPKAVGLAAKPEARAAAAPAAASATASATATAAALGHAATSAEPPCRELLSAGRQPSPEEFVRLAIACESEGDDPAACEALKKALFLDKNLAVGHFLIATIHERQGRVGDAVRHYRTVERLLASQDTVEEVRLSDGLTVGMLREHVAQRLRRIAA